MYFKPFKTALGKAVDIFAEKLRRDNAGIPEYLNKAYICELLDYAIRSLANPRDLVLTGFQATGIFPFDPKKVMDSKSPQRVRKSCFSGIF